MSDPAHGVTQYALLSDAGPERSGNEDAGGVHVEGPTHVVVAIADGVSGHEGGEIASRMAVESTLRSYRESPSGWGPAKRLFRAAQEANVEIHDRAMVVTELRRMSTTLTAVAVDGGMAHVVHIGDSRLYAVTAEGIVQKTKDHTVAARRQRMGVISSERAKTHPGKALLTRSLGSELIAAIDRITFRVADGDRLILCTDGAYNVLGDDELLVGSTREDLDVACKELIAAAWAKGATDNLTVAMIRVMGCQDIPSSGWSDRLSRWLGT